MPRPSVNSPRRLVVATGNRHKLQEISAILGHGWDILSAADVAPGVTWEETGTTFLENARIKAQAIRAHTKDCILADDSGLCVDVLGGAPGVWSSSYGGKEGDHSANTQRLLRELTGVAEPKRTAHFTCLLLFIDESGAEHVFEGRCDGRIAMERDGDGGFGYDPVFWLPERGCTMARLSENEKNEISHRGHAMAKLQALLG